MTPGHGPEPSTAQQRLADLARMLDDLEALHGAGGWITLERRRVAQVRQSVAKHHGRLTRLFATVLSDIEAVVLWRLLAVADWVLQTEAFVD